MHQKSILLTLVLAMVGYASMGQRADGHASEDSVRRQKIQFAPLRFMYAQEKGYHASWISMEQDIKIIRNFCNFGFLADFGFGIKETQTKVAMAGVYVEPYVAINRLLKKYKKQDKGFFITAKVGYGVFVVSATDTVAHALGPICGYGVDYLITKNFGASFSGVYFLDNYAPPILCAGINVRFK